MFPVLPSWPVRQTDQLVLDAYELCKFEECGGLLKNFIDPNCPVRTALHGWGNQLMQCPCSCRAFPLSDDRLRTRGLHGALLPLPGITHTRFGEITNARHIHPYEIAATHGVVPNWNWEPLKMGMCGLGQMASPPVQACWLASQIVQATSALTEVEARSPEESLHLHLMKVCGVVATDHPQISSHPKFQNLVKRYDECLGASRFTHAKPTALMGPTSHPQEEETPNVERINCFATQALPVTPVFSSIAHDTKEVECIPFPAAHPTIQADPVETPVPTGPSHVGCEPPFHANPVCAFPCTTGPSHVPVVEGLSQFRWGSNLKRKHEVGAPAIKLDVLGCASQSKRAKHETVGDVMTQGGVASAGANPAWAFPCPAGPSHVNTETPFHANPPVAPFCPGGPSHVSDTTALAKVDAGFDEAPGAPDVDPAAGKSTHADHVGFTHGGDDLTHLEREVCQPTQLDFSPIKERGEIHCAGDTFTPNGGFEAFRKVDPLASDVRPPLPAKDIEVGLTQEIAANIDDIETAVGSIEQTLAPAPIVTHAVQVIHDDDTNPMIVEIPKDATVGSLTVATASLQGTNGIFTVLTPVGTHLPTAAHTEPFQRLHVRNMDYYGTTDPRQMGMPAQLSTQAQCTRIQLLHRQEAWVAQDEMNFYLGMIAATGHAVSHPVLFLPDPILDDDLFGMVKQWIMQCEDKCRVHSQVVSAILVQNHWFPYTSFVRE